MEEQPLLEGPTEELLQGRPCGQLPDEVLQQLREAGGVPENLRQMPYVNLEIGSRYSNQQVGHFFPGVSVLLSQSASYKLYLQRIPRRQRKGAIAMIVWMAGA
jgi:hypothetical protein